MVLLLGTTVPADVAQRGTGVLHSGLRTPKYSSRIVLVLGVLSRRRHAGLFATGMHSSTTVVVGRTPVLRRHTSYR